MKAIYYVPNWRDSNLTSDMTCAWAFLNVDPQGNLIIADWEDDNRLKKLLADPNHPRDFQLSIGGWNYSKNFSSAVSNITNRARFVDSIISVLNKYPLFNTINIDWEFLSDNGVNRGEVGNGASINDVSNFKSFIQLLKSKIPELRISMCVAGNVMYFNDPVIFGLLDEIHVMTYDLFGTWSGKSGHHSGLYSSAKSEYSCDKGIQLFLNAGIPASKLYMGACMYQHIFQNCTEIGAPSSGGDSVAYNTIAFDQNYIKYWDPECKADYWVNQNTRIVQTGDSVRSMHEKVKYAKEKGLGGLLIWEITQDIPDRNSEHSLVRAVTDAMQGKPLPNSAIAPNMPGSALSPPPTTGPAPPVPKKTVTKVINPDISLGLVCEDADVNIKAISQVADKINYRYLYFNGGPLEYGWWYNYTTKELNNQYGAPEGNRMIKFLANCDSLKVSPCIVWYCISGQGESYTGDRENANNPTFMAAYYDILNKTCNLVGNRHAKWIIEPDYIGYMAQNSKQRPSEIQTVDGTLTDTVKKINNIIKSKCPNSVISWQINMWASPHDGSGAMGLIRTTDDKKWNDQGKGLEAGRAWIFQEAKWVAEYYRDAGIMENTNSFSVDHFGLDFRGTMPSGTPAWKIAWAWNQQHFENFLLYVKTISDTLGGAKCDLWQMCTGHLNNSQRINPRTNQLYVPHTNTPGNYESGMGTSLFGDTFIPDPSEFEFWSIGGVPNGNKITYPNAFETGALKNANVQSVLLGAGVGSSTNQGTTLGSLRPDGEPQDDHWLFDRLRENGKGSVITITEEEVSVPSPTPDNPSAPPTTPQIPPPAVPTTPPTPSDIPPPIKTDNQANGSVPIPRTIDLTLPKPSPLVIEGGFALILASIVYFFV